LFKLSILFTYLPDLVHIKKLKIGKPLAVIGIVILLAGIIFHLQGQAILGPESSFMYSNPDWITKGQQIAIGGLGILGIGIGLLIAKRSNRSHVK